MTLNVEANEHCLVALLVWLIGNCNRYVKQTGRKHCDCVLQEPTVRATLQSDMLANTMHSSVFDSAVNTSGTSSVPAAIDHLASALSATTLSSSQPATASRRDFTVMIPVRPAQLQSATVTQHSPVVTPVSCMQSAQLMVCSRCWSSHTCVWQLSACFILPSKKACFYAVVYTSLASSIHVGAKAGGNGPGWALGMKRLRPGGQRLWLREVEIGHKNPFWRDFSKTMQQLENSTAQTI